MYLQHNYYILKLQYVSGKFVCKLRSSLTCYTSIHMDCVYVYFTVKLDSLFVLHADINIDF